MTDVTKVQAVPMATFAGSSLTGTYQVMNSGGFSKPIKMLKVFNGTNQTITISLDGSTDNDVLPANATLILDFEANGSKINPSGRPWRMAKGQFIWGKAAAGTGTLYISGYY